MMKTASYILHSDRTPIPMNTPSIVKDRIGVSAVIAVILMTGMTVVLSGVVFLWSQAFSAISGSSPGLATFEIEAMDDPSGDAIEISLIGGDFSWKDSKVQITPEGGSPVYGDLSSAPPHCLAGETLRISSFVDGSGSAAILALNPGDPLNVKIISNSQIVSQKDLLVA
jgi:FlaG/FlaF family flagellin (archaellin)